PVGGDAGAGKVDESVMAPLRDDLNTVAAVQALHALAGKAVGDETASGTFAASANILGIAPKKIELSKALEEGVESIIQMRLEMLKAKNFAEADKIRDDLLAKGIQLKDSKDPETGARVTTWEVKR